jgi:hypothetical protein
MNIMSSGRISMSIDHDLPFTVELDSSDKVENFKNELSRGFQANDIKIYSIDKIEISGQTSMADIEYEQLFIYSQSKDLLMKVTKPFAKLKTHKWEKTELISDRKEFEGLYMPYLYEKTILNFLNRLHIDKGEINGSDLIDELLSKVPNSRSCSSMPMDVINREFHSLSKELEKMEAERKEALLKGQRHARRVLSLGFVILGGQIALVVMGVYVYYNWDIMEPIMYFLQYAGVLAIGSLFFLTRAKFENQRFAQWLVCRAQKRYLNRANFDHHRYSEVVERLKENHSSRLKNILNDF